MNYYENWCFSTNLSLYFENDTIYDHTVRMEVCDLSNGVIFNKLKRPPVT